MQNGRTRYKGKYYLLIKTTRDETSGWVSRSKNRRRSALLYHDFERWMHRVLSPYFTAILRLMRHALGEENQVLIMLQVAAASERARSRRTARRAHHSSRVRITPRKLTLIEDNCRYIAVLLVRFWKSLFHWQVSVKSTGECCNKLDHDCCWQSSRVQRYQGEKKKNNSILSYYKI